MCVCVCSDLLRRLPDPLLPGVPRRGWELGCGRSSATLSLPARLLSGHQEWRNISAGQLPKPGGVEGEVKVGGEAAIDPGWNARQGAQQD